MDKISSILFVCLGNICRSPLAHGIARELIKSKNLNIKVDSAGVSGYHQGERPHINSMNLARKNNFDISDLASRKINLDDNEIFNMIIVMDTSNYEALIKMGFEKNKLSKLGDFGLGGVDIPDPYYMDENGYENIYKMIEDATKNLISSIAKTK